MPISTSWPAALNIVNRFDPSRVRIASEVQTGIYSGPWVQQSIPKALSTDYRVTKAFTPTRLFAVAVLQAGQNGDVLQSD